jgi:hypothetical protein
LNVKHRNLYILRATQFNSVLNVKHKNSLHPALNSDQAVSQATTQLSSGQLLHAQQFDLKLLHTQQPSSANCTKSVDLGGQPTSGQVRLLRWQQVRMARTRAHGARGLRCAHGARLVRRAHAELCCGR